MNLPPAIVEESLKSMLFASLCVIDLQLKVMTGHKLLPEVTPYAVLLWNERRFKIRVKRDGICEYLTSHLPKYPRIAIRIIQNRGQWLAGRRGYTTFL